MQVLYHRCCGLDIHKKLIVACLLSMSVQGVHKEIRTFGTTLADLYRLRDWLVANECQIMAMESTGVYWKPIWNMLEEELKLLLVNAQHIKAVPGRKTDTKDAEWIADLLQHGLLSASFVPPRPLRELRELTRYRTKLVYERARLVNRIQKVQAAPHHSLNRHPSTAFAERYVSGVHWRLFGWRAHGEIAVQGPLPEHYLIDNLKLCARLNRLTETMMSL